MSSLRPSRFRTAGGADPSLDDDAMGLSPSSAAASAKSQAGGIWRQKHNDATKKPISVHVAPAAAAAATQTGTTPAEAEAKAKANTDSGDDGGAGESRQCLSPRHISSRNLSDGANLDRPFDETADGKQPTSLPTAVRSGLKLGNEIKSTDEATFEDDEEDRDDPEGEESAVSTLAVSVDTYLDEVKAPEAGAETPSKVLTTSPRRKNKKGKKSRKKGKSKKGKSTAAAPDSLTAANLASFDDASVASAPSDEEVDDAYFSLSNSLSGFSSVTGASNLDDDDAVAAVAAVAATTPKQGTSTPLTSQAALRLSLWRDHDTVILSQTSPTKSRAATAATAAADVIVTSQKRAGAGAGAGGPESMRPKSQGELLLPSLCSGAASVQDESVVDQASSTVSSIMARGTATPRGHTPSSPYTFANAGSNDADSGVKKEVSFTQVRDAMRRFLSTSPKADEGPSTSTAEATSSANERRSTDKQAAFWSKCAVLAATAVMATAKTANNRVQIAQAAAETVLTKCPKGEDAASAPTDEDWRIAAAEGLEDLAAKVSAAIIAVGTQDGQIPAATTAAASAAAVVLLNQKEALEILATEAATEQETAVDAEAIDDAPKAAVSVVADVDDTTAAAKETPEGPKEAPKAVEEDMIESWRKEESSEIMAESTKTEDKGDIDDDIAASPEENTSTPASTDKALEKSRSVDSELLSVGETELSPAPSVEAKVDGSEGEDAEDDGNSAPAATAAAVATAAAAAAAAAVITATSDADAVPTVEEAQNVVEAAVEEDRVNEEPKADNISPEKEANEPGKEEAEPEKETEASSADDEWLNIDKPVPEAAKEPFKEDSMGAKIAVTVAAASAVAASAAATTVAACCSPAEVTSSKEAVVEVEASAETKDEEIEVANATAADVDVVDDAAPDPENLGAKIALGIATASVAAASAAAATAVACCSPTEAASAEKVAEAEASTEEPTETKEQTEITATSLAATIATAAVAAAAHCSSTDATSPEKANDEVKEENISTPVDEAPKEEKEGSAVNDVKEIAHEEPVHKELASTEAEPVAAETTAEDVAVEVSKDTKEAPEESALTAATEDPITTKVPVTAEESTKESTDDSESTKEAADSDAKEDDGTKDEATATTETSSIAIETKLEEDASHVSAEVEAEETAPVDETKDATSAVVDEKDVSVKPLLEADVSTKSKNTQLLEDLEDKQKERNAKMDKIRDFEVYLASVTSCASNEEKAGEVVITCDTSKEDIHVGDLENENQTAKGEDVVKSASVDFNILSPKSAGDETEVSLKRDTVADEPISADPAASTKSIAAEPASSTDPIAADAEVVIVSAGSEGETEVSLSDTDTAVQETATTEEPAMESEKTAEAEAEAPTTESSTLKPNDTGEEEKIGSVASAKRTLSEESTIFDTVEEAPSSDEAGCHVNFSNTVKEGLAVFAATVAASCTMPTSDNGDDAKIEEDSKEVVEPKEATEAEATEEESNEETTEEKAAEEKAIEEEEPKEADEPTAVEEQPVPEQAAPEPVGEADLPADPSEATDDSAVGEQVVEIDESSSMESTKEEEYPSESIEIVDEAPQLPVAKKAAIEANVDVVQQPTTPSKKSRKKKFSSVKKIFKKKTKKFEL